MATKLLRSLRFVSFRFDARESIAGFRLGQRGELAMVEEDAAVRQSLMLLLSTRPGERVMRPAYGCDLMTLVFEPINSTTAGLAIHYIRRAIMRWEPRIDILDLDAGPNEEDPGRLDIALSYRLRRTLAQEDLAFSINLMGPV